MQIKQNFNTHTTFFSICYNTNQTTLRKKDLTHQ